MSALTCIAQLETVAKYFAKKNLVIPFASLNTAPDEYAYRYQDKVEDHQRKLPVSAYNSESGYYRSRSASTPAKYAVKGGVAPREGTRGQEERREDYLQDSGGGYAPDSAESTDADTMYDSQVSHIHLHSHLIHVTRYIASAIVLASQVESVVFKLNVVISQYLHAVDLYGLTCTTGSC